MNSAEIAAFLAEPAAQDALRLRGYDEAGKAPEAEVSSFESYQDLLRDLIARAAEA